MQFSQSPNRAVCRWKSSAHWLYTVKKNTFPSDWKNKIEDKNLILRHTNIDLTARDFKKFLNHGEIKNKSNEERETKLKTERKERERWVTCWELESTWMMGVSVTISAVD